tara:strand:- start:98 stop:469 length:372 start_codon:yes stop_codon:yes gene_type:complete
MKWIGQHIYDLISRFRYYVYLEKVDLSTSTKVIVVEPDGKVSYNSRITDDILVNTGKETDKNYAHTQSALASVWVVTHNLAKHPSVSVVDSAGTVVIGVVDYDSINQVTLTFKATFSGKAYFN